jgi:FtsH-binding integral membrane protein
MRHTWAAIDVAVVLLFVGIGRSVHDHGVNVAGMASTTWPFAVGLCAAWLALAASRRSGLTPTDGAVACAITVLVGMSLRAVSGQGIAAAFVLVALCFLGASMIGWRWVRAILRRARRSRDHA